MTAEDAFRFYESVRSRLPSAAHPQTFSHAADLGEIAENYDVFVFDAFGVLNVGDTPIAGARARLDALRAAGKTVFVLTNAASLGRQATLAKFARLGFDFAEREIVSSREGARLAFAAVPDKANWGVITTAEDECADFDAPLRGLLDEAKPDFDAVEGIVFLSTARWTEDLQQALEASMLRRPRPLIVGNPDAVAPRESGLSLEPGFFGHRVADRAGAPVAFHGKPFPSVYDLVERALPGGTPAGRVLMLGDTLHTDVLGAAARGWATALVSDHGLFRGLDVERFIEESGIVPDWIIPAI
ncbi:HAD hydrolase-like protein [Stappia sp. F7233]|uniref:HAD hydrolase-like protein n=2 Tax=Stappia albiluteola TaxID=2758565 RepID=A0A839AH87_9HYPH|nr:HAD hydrolase-like protein [Stappia albiluteola]